MPSRKRESDKRSETHQKKVAVEQNFMQPGTRSVRETATVHFYLVCWYMITMRKEGGL